MNFLSGDFTNFVKSGPIFENDISFEASWQGKLNDVSSVRAKWSLTKLLGVQKVYKLNT